MKTALITGVGRGIGKALADKFLAEGWKVVGTVQSTAASTPHKDLSVYQLDLADPLSIAKRAEQIGRLEPKIDVLINNAGVLFDDEDTRLFTDKLRKTLEVNVIGTADITERTIGAMNGDGHIIFISSAAGSLSDMDEVGSSHFPYHYPAYKISKCALNMYMRTLAVRLKHEGKDITVSSVHPGWVKTDMGGEEAPVTPEEAADNIFKLAVSRPETGQFWHNGQKYPW